MFFPHAVVKGGTDGNFPFDFFRLKVHIRVSFIHTAESVLNAGSATINLGGGWDNSAGGIMNMGTSLVVFDYPTAWPKEIHSGGGAFNAVTVSSADRLKLKDDMTVLGNLALIYDML